MIVNIITLGCSKNTVDSEKLLKQLELNGYQVLHNSPKDADVVIINTCGFILDAKTESIETILAYCHAKESGFLRKIFVMGCLSQRYKESLKEELPTVDGFFGVNDTDNILRTLGGTYHAGLMHSRILTTPSHYAYLKISEGCNRNCAFCAIPLIRGKQESVPIEKLLQETSELAESGVKEIMLIAQDLTSYGIDIYKERKLLNLVETLSGIQGIEWIRLHYAYPDSFPLVGLSDLMIRTPNLCRYLDIPFQHISDQILKRMHRGHDKRVIMEIIEYLRKEIPGICLRTTLISGFPGETDKEFQELYDFVRDIRFDRLGIFTYSHEEGTPAEKELEDNVPEDEKIRRMEAIMNLQESISLELNAQKVGSVLKVIIDGEEGEFYKGRTEHDSPEIDQEVLIPITQKTLETGEFYTIKITDALEFDLFGEAL